MDKVASSTAPVILEQYRYNKLKHNYERSLRNYSANVAFYRKIISFQVSSTVAFVFQHHTSKWSLLMAYSCIYPYKVSADYLQSVQ